MGRKFGGGAPPLFGEGERGPHLTQSRPGPRPTSIPSGILIYDAAIWPQRIWAENWGGCAPLGKGELGPHLTQCGQGRGVPSVKPFGHNTPTSQTGQTYRTGQTTDGYSPVSYTHLTLPTILRV